MSSLGNEPETP